MTAKPNEEKKLEGLEEVCKRCSITAQFLTRLVKKVGEACPKPELDSVKPRTEMGDLRQTVI
jgi:hypothetical protein